MKSLGSLRMGLISATPTAATTAWVVPAGKRETCRPQGRTTAVPLTQFSSEIIPQTSLVFFTLYVYDVCIFYICATISSQRRDRV